MKLTAESYGKSYTVDLTKGVSIGIPVQRKNAISAWGLGVPEYKYYESADFIGAVRNGGPCNVEVIQFVPHTNGTHTECIGHITKDEKFVLDNIKDTFYSARLITLSSQLDDSGTEVLDFSAVIWKDLETVDALVIRSQPNTESKISKNYASSNPSYISASDMQKIVDSGINHLVIDLPSVDPESDGGALVAHRIFWQTMTSTLREDSSITEFTYIPDNVQDGNYFIKLNISPFQSDASPSNPILYPIV